MHHSFGKAALIVIMIVCFAVPVYAQVCVDCHMKTTPNLVADWQSSRHSKNGIDCAMCHGDKHSSAQDTALAKLPTPETCAQCHEARVAQYKKGKHALGWASMNAMPMAHMQPMALMEGQKGCGGCHKIGIKSEAEIKDLRKQGAVFGAASCDSCHTRHSFSVKEARQPQACQTCHMGFDHPQWEMYSGSKHGVRYLLKQNGTLPETTVAPTCQTCHMQNGDHEVRAPWGFLAVRLPMPDDKQWAADREVILKALGVLDPKGNPTPRLAVVKAADVARLNQDDWQAGRDKMLRTCNQCHSMNFAKAELQKGDDMIKAADGLMAEAIRIVAGLYQDGIIEKPKTYAFAYPDLLMFHYSPTPIEQKLFVMFLEHRMRTFQGTFHANPDYALWYGWSEMKRTLTDIQYEAADLREKSAMKTIKAEKSVQVPQKAKPQKKK